ncbi:hypothetical protein ANN_12489 [Periplaneta americana]|uniref:Uncharacterized protein n=1 Tax=Periplaneta americana TaxID=6978 RepID=A0ABQ8TIV6_PERAM|nr:hypothetical protein ANN_12489 [Periplaneta americana]
MRQRVIALVEAGYGARSAGRLVGVPGSTAARVFIVTKFRGGRKSPYSWASADFFIGRGYSLIETVRLDPFRTANEIRAASNFPGSSQTVISRLRNRCIRSRRAAQMEILGKHKLSAILPSLPIEWISIGEMYDGYLASERDEGDNAGEMSPRSSTDSYPAFARNGLRENPGKNLNQHRDAFGELRQVAKIRFRKPAIAAGGDHRANHTIPPYWLDDHPPLLRYVDVRPAASGWSWPFMGCSTTDLLTKVLGHLSGGIQVPRKHIS